MSLAVLLSAVATTQIGFVTLSRVSYAMGTDGLLPPRFGQLSPRYRTPAFGTMLFAVITIVVTGASVFSSSVADAFAEIVATTGVLYGSFYAISAVTGTWYFRSKLRDGAGNLFVVGVLPVAAAAFLAWIIIKSVADFTRAKPSPCWAYIATGVVMLAIAEKPRNLPTSAFRGRNTARTPSRLRRDPGLGAEQLGLAHARACVPTPSALRLGGSVRTALLALLLHARVGDLAQPRLVRVQVLAQTALGFRASPPSADTSRSSGTSRGALLRGRAGCRT